MSAERIDPSASALQGVNAYWRALDAEAIQRGEHRAFIGAMWEDIGQLQLTFLQSQGLQPQHRLLDVGCGALRGGVHFVHYLQHGHYYGIDANASLIDAAQHELKLAGLQEHDAQLMANADFDVAAFGQRFDFAIAVSLITHLYSNHVQICLARVAKVLAPGGRFFVTFFEAPNAAYLDPLAHSPGDIVSHYAQDPFHQSFDELATLAARAGLRAERIGAFGHPRGQHMAVFHAP